MQNIISPAAGELERPMPHTLAPLSSPIPVGVCVGEGVVSGYKWLVQYESSCLSSGK